MLARTIYFKRTKPTGASSIESARVWDAGRFLTQLKKDAAAAAKNEGIVGDKIEPATEAEYYAAKRSK